MRGIKHTQKNTENIAEIMLEEKRKRKERNNMDAHKLEVQTLIETLRNECTNNTIEGELVKKKLVRQLYKMVGEPTQVQFPNIYATAGGCWKKFDGYTNDIGMDTKSGMEHENNKPTEWRIARPSETKQRLVEEYTRAGWNCTVQAYNVMCERYEKHPEYDNLWVRFYASRDCNKYELIIEAE